MNPQNNQHWAPLQPTCEESSSDEEQESTVTNTSSNEPKQPDRGFTSGILLNLFTHSLASLGTPIPPVPTTTLPAPPPPPQNMMSSSLLKATVSNATIKATELKIGALSDFDGDQKNAMSWLYSVQTYLLVNEELYDTDTKKPPSRRLLWKRPPPSFGTFANFTKDFKSSFTSPDTAGTAITKLHTMKQKDLVEQYITDFQTAATDSTITEDVMLIELISEWYTHAQKFDAKWRKVNELSGKKEKRTFYPKNNLAEEKDPNAMDMDGVRLSKEERDCHIKEGRCFSCGNKGHLSQECLDKGKTPQKRVKKICKIVEVEESDDEEKVTGPLIALVNIARALGKDF
ncbi:hypothetical protein M404DRAFT_33715 [Pisolithus tinctorius Marx 270]|uniref:CCHC-type domain-containing protein n=1 Tax=Pisolithus tinctorius Marx 270 TaxID=870435 RepID=A0A0C3JEB6_PISTI|nr:hypothetical protein M404DRAFT_33715 [Pisolithus tinctorius Marx 270]